MNSPTSAAADASRVDLSVVLPIYNEEKGIGELHQRLIEVLSATGLWYEVIMVNDGSRDGSWRRIMEVGGTDRRVCGINLSRNFGHQIAITAGVELSRGAAVVVMDSDLQDPPEAHSDALRKAPRRVRRRLCAAPHA